MYSTNHVILKTVYSTHHVILRTVYSTYHVILKTVYSTHVLCMKTPEQILISAPGLFTGSFPRPGEWVKICHFIGTWWLQCQQVSVVYNKQPILGRLPSRKPVFRQTGFGCGRPDRGLDSVVLDRFKTMRFWFQSRWEVERVSFFFHFVTSFTC